MKDKNIESNKGKIFYQGQQILNDFYIKHSIITFPITMCNYFWRDKLQGFEEKTEIKQKGIKAYERNAYRHQSYNKM